MTYESIRTKTHIANVLASKTKILRFIVYISRSENNFNNLEYNKDGIFGAIFTSWTYYDFS